jgi:hypothetical protein
MRAAVIGAVIGAGLMALALGGFAEGGRALAQRPSSAEAAANAEVIALTSTLGDNRQQLTLIDPRMRVMSVYHVDAASGGISLKSVRNFHWDMQMVEFNNAKPLPQEIRSMIDHR